MRLSIKTKPMARKTFSVSAINKTKTKLNKLNEKYTPAGLKELRRIARTKRQASIRDNKRAEAEKIAERAHTRIMGTVDSAAKEIYRQGYKNARDFGARFYEVGFKDVDSIVKGMRVVGLTSVRDLYDGLASAQRRATRSKGTITNKQILRAVKKISEK